MNLKISEVELDHAFAEALAASPIFQRWLLSKGRFARVSDRAHLMVLAQAQARKRAAHWWKHWWCKMPDGSESETDIFCVFECDGFRFALHIENKPAYGELLLKQAVDYRRRAAFKANDPNWLSYSDFETILLAPAAFLHGNAECLAQFDRALVYEDVAPFIPLFQRALRDGQVT